MTGNGTAGNAQALKPVVLGLGTGYGYSGMDLTNPRDAALGGEVPFLPAEPGQSADAVIELRIHGVGGAPPQENLECPATLQVAGDNTAGFYRAWHPGVAAPAGKIRKEAYCWGALNYRAASRALWLLLVSFMIVNVAHWALPDTRTKRATAWRNTVCRSLLRLLGLAFTVTFVATSVTVLVDLIAWQGPHSGALPSWLGAYARLAKGPRLALALFAVLTLVAVLCLVSVQTVKSYEKWTVDGCADKTPEWAMTDPDFWRGERTVVRQRDCHIGVACAVVILFAVLPTSSHHGLRMAAVIGAGLLAAAAVILLASPWSDRMRAASVMEKKTADIVCRWFAIGAVVAAVGLSATRFWWRPYESAHALPGDQPVQSTIIFVQAGLIALLVIVLLLQAPWQQPDVMGFGMAAALLALLASLLTTIFGATLTLTIANLLGSPKVTLGHIPDKIAVNTLYLPSTIYAGGVGMLVAVVAVAFFAVGALIWTSRESRRLARTDGARDSVRSAYPNEGGPKSVKRVAGIWARSSLTNKVAEALTIITLPTAAVVIAYQGWLVATGRPGNVVLLKLASFGGTLGVLATGYFLVQLRSALLTTVSRKRFGLLWDVGTFWPRACHPFAPPCYAERSVPEVVTRIRRLVGDESHGDKDPAFAQEQAERASGQSDDPLEAHSPVLLSGYSQGSPIAVAVMAQLPAGATDRVALLTLAAPVRRLYGRTFPAYFGPHQLAVLRQRLTSGDTVRWRNLVRRSDYIGGWVLTKLPVPADAPTPAVDHEILDPPVLWLDDNPSPPPAHLHSDWFPDPQTRPYATVLAATLSPVPPA